MWNDCCNRSDESGYLGILYKLCLYNELERVYSRNYLEYIKPLDGRRRLKVVSRD